MSIIFFVENYKCSTYFRIGYKEKLQETNQVLDQTKPNQNNKIDASAGPSASVEHVAPVNHVVPNSSVKLVACVNYPIGPNTIVELNGIVPLKLKKNK